MQLTNTDQAQGALAQEPAAESSATEGARASGQAVVRPSPWLYLGLLGVIVVSAAAGLMIGRGQATDAAMSSVFLSMRAHRVAVAFLCGAGLSVAGAVVQGLFRNPLASPSILGVSAGATLGANAALLGTVLFLGGRGLHGVAPEMMVPVGAVLGACLALLVLLSVASVRSSPLSLLLTGFALMSLFGGASALLTTLGQHSVELYRAMQMLQSGSISAVGPKQLMLCLVMILGGALPALAWSGSLDLLLCGEEEAAALGVDVKRARFWLVLWVAIMVSGAVAVGGGVGFVGLIVPHALRPYAGQAHRYLLPAAFLAGGAFVVVCDVACRALPLTKEIPLGVVTDLIGAPVFLRMLSRLVRSGEMT